MKTPVMMVHGMCCTGEVWALFQQFFEDRGARVFTPSLRPEARTPITGKPERALKGLRLFDYVADLEREARRIEAETGYKPAVIGHSMGGLLSQALAERNCVSAATFISPAPPAGAHDFRSSVFWSFVGVSNAIGVAPWAIKPNRRTVFASVMNVVPKDEREAAFASMVYESGPAFNDMGRFVIDENKIKVPVMTVAATQDRLVPAKVVRLVGKKYAAIGGMFREYAKHGHWLYSEPGWEQAADDIYTWLASVTQNIAPSEPPLRDTAALDEARV